MKKVKKLNISKYVIFILLVLELIVFSLASSNFYKPGNLLNVCRQVSMIGISATGMTAVMLTGGIDISIGPIVAMSGVIAAKLIVEAGFSPIIAVLLAVMIATMVGVVNGMVITRFKVTPMIVTLGMMTVCKGAAYLLTGGIPIYGLPEGYAALGQGYFLGIPNAVYLLILIFILGYWFIERTYIGRRFYATGGNEEAARLSGIATDKVKILAYSLNGFCAGIAGIVMSSRINSGQPSVANAFEMDVIPAVVLGGISMAGGEGHVSGVVAGVLIMGVLANGMSVLGLPEYWQWVVKGIVLIFAVSYDNVSKGIAKGMITKKTKGAAS